MVHDIKLTPAPAPSTRPVAAPYDTARDPAPDDAARHIDLAHQKLAEFESSPTILKLHGAVVHLFDAVKAGFAGGDSRPARGLVDDAAVEQAQAEAIARQHGADPLAFAVARRVDAEP